MPTISIPGTAEKSSCYKKQMQSDKVWQWAQLAHGQEDHPLQEPPGSFLASLAVSERSVTSHIEVTEEQCKDSGAFLKAENVTGAAAAEDKKTQESQESEKSQAVWLHHQRCSSHTHCFSVRRRRGMCKDASRLQPGTRADYSTSVPPPP